MPNEPVVSNTVMKDTSKKIWEACARITRAEDERVYAAAVGIPLVPETYPPFVEGENYVLDRENLKISFRDRFSDPKWREMPEWIGADFAIIPGHPAMVHCLADGRFQDYDGYGNKVGDVQK